MVVSQTSRCDLDRAIFLQIWGCLSGIHHQLNGLLEFDPIMYETFKARRFVKRLDSPIKQCRAISIMDIFYSFRCIYSHQVQNFNQNVLFYKYYYSQYYYYQYFFIYFLAFILQLYNVWFNLYTYNFPTFICFRLIYYTEGIILIILIMIILLFNIMLLLISILYLCIIV